MISFDDKVDACSIVNDIKCRMGDAVSYDAACTLASALIIADAIKGGYTSDSVEAGRNARARFRAIEGRSLRGDRND